MTKLINAEKLEEYKVDCCVPLTQWQEGWNDAIDMIMDETPIVDAVPVVRCKDCKWWKTNYSWNGNEHKVCVREAYEPLRKAEDFCSRGERKENEGYSYRVD